MGLRRHALRGRVWGRSRRAGRGQVHLGPNYQGLLEEPCFQDSSRTREARVRAPNEISMVLVALDSGRACGTSRANHPVDPVLGLTRESALGARDLHRIQLASKESRLLNIVR